jgi:hypothetical protein
MLLYINNRHSIMFVKYKDKNHSHLSASHVRMYKTYKIIK